MPFPRSRNTERKHVGFRLEKNEYTKPRDGDSLTETTTCVDPYDFVSHSEGQEGYKCYDRREEESHNLRSRLRQRKAEQKRHSPLEAMQERSEREQSQQKKAKRPRQNRPASEANVPVESTDSSSFPHRKRFEVKTILKNHVKAQPTPERNSEAAIMRESRTEKELRSEVTDFLNSIGSTDALPVSITEKQIRWESTVKAQTACEKFRSMLTKCSRLMRDVRLGPEFNGVELKKLWVNPTFKGEFRLSAGSLVMQRKIGSGSFGVVYYAIDHETNRKYAVKCVRKRTTDSQRAVKSQEKEFYVWRETTGHPNIIPLYAAFESSRAYCFVMDYVKTGSLNHVLRKNKLTDKVTEKIAAQLAHAIHTVHMLGCLHRDISCSNILITPNFDVRLTDFGISVVGLTATTRCGSLAYMAPEVLACRKSGPGADWWSYGIVLFTMFEGMTPLSLYVKRWNIDLDRLSKLNRYEVAKNASVPINPLLEKSKKDLLKDIFRDDPSKRLGVRRKMSFEEFKQHQYFRGIDWSELDEALSQILESRAKDA